MRKPPDIVQMQASGSSLRRPFPILLGAKGQAWRLARHMVTLILLLSLPHWSIDTLHAETALLAAPGHKKILLLYSYGYGGKGVDVFNDAFRSVMDEAGLNVDDLFFEYLDIERNREDPEYRPQLRKLLLEKYATRDIGLVVTIQQPALDFLLHEGRDLAPAAPAITLQAPLPTPTAAQGRPIIGQLVEFDIKGTLAHALSAFPQTQEIMFVSGSSKADRKMAADAELAMAPWRGQLKFDTSADLSLDQMLEKVAHLPPRSVIVFTQYNRDSGGRVTRSYEVERMLVQAANAPVFGLYDYNLVNGGIGGSVVSVKALGERTARTTLDILNGKLQPTLPVMSLSNSAVPMFDWQQIQRWGGDASRLPQDTIFVNRPTTIWNSHRDLIVGSLAIFLLQTLMILALIINRRRRMAAEKMLLDSEERYRCRLDVALDHKRQYEEGLELLLDLNQRSGQMTEQQICDLALDIAVKTTRSEIGYLHQLNDDQNTLSLVTWNAAALKHCTSRYETHYPLAGAGIWADCARMRRPVIHNDYQNMPDKKTSPEGHAHLLRHMSAPVLDGERVRMIVGVGNKASDYVEEDSRQLQLVANEVQRIVMRRRAEQSLHESEARFRFITDLSPGMVWVTDASMRATWFNKTWLGFSGKTMEQILGRGWTQAVHPEDIQACLTIYADRLNKHQSLVHEFRLRRHDGVYRWVLNTGQPRFGENGTLEGYVGTCLDITERKEAEAQLSMLWMAVEQTSHSIIITDVDARIEYVNRAFCEISGYSVAEVVGQNPRLLHSGQTPAARYTEMWDALMHGDVWQGEFTNQRKNGEIYIESVRISPLRQPDGRITHYLGIKEDISEQMRQAEAISEAKILLQRVIDSTPDWIHVKDGEQRFMLVNQSFASAFDETPDRMIGRYDSDTTVLAPSFDGSSLDKGQQVGRDEDDAAFRGHTTHNPCERVAFENGGVRIFDTIKGPLRDSSQRIYGILTYRRDITERFNKEQEQHVLEAQLRQAQKMELIGHLTGGIAHDFNNILSSIFGYAELMQMSADIKLNSQLNQFLDEILQAGMRAKELVAQLLTFSHRREVATDAILVAPIIKEVKKLLRATVPTSILIRSTLAKSLPEVLISPVQLHQILMNLGINARDAIVDKGIIEITAEQVVVDDFKSCSACHEQFHGEHVMISVRDTGMGISPENLVKIFDPFFTTKAIGRGSGLGLSVLHGIVHSANGHIEVLTAPGEGTAFRIYLPAQERKVERLTSVAQANVDQASFVAGHVLVVDDDPSIVGFITALLQNFGCRVTGLTSAAAALRLFKDNPQGVDMVISDQTMPDLTGTELARAMLALRPDIPIVLSTGYSNAIDEDAARQIGIRRFLTKPVPAKVLTDVVAEYLGGSADKD